jgi:hypothetical protein
MAAVAVKARGGELAFHYADYGGGSLVPKTGFQLPAAVEIAALLWPDLLHGDGIAGGGYSCVVVDRSPTRRRCRKRRIRV